MAETRPAMTVYFDNDEQKEAFAAQARQKRMSNAAYAIKILTEVCDLPTPIFFDDVSLISDERAEYRTAGAA